MTGSTNNDENTIQVPETKRRRIESTKLKDFESNLTDGADSPNLHTGHSTATTGSAHVSTKTPRMGKESNRASYSSTANSVYADNEESEDDDDDDNNKSYVEGM